MAQMVQRISPATVTRIMRTVLGNAAFVGLIDSADPDIRAWRYEFERAKDMSYAQAAEGLQALVDASAISANQRTACLRAWPTL